MKTTLSKTRNVVAGVHYTTSHTAKMAGLASLSTDINLNPLCQARRRNGAAVCSVCFSASLWDDKRGQYRKGNAAFKRNTEILCNHILTGDEIPVIDPARFPLFRFEAFADLQSVTQVINYFNIAKNNPGVKFALWTKNPGFVARALKFTTKPENLQIVLSSLRLNRPTATNYEFIDKIFTVYDEKTIDAEQININCGARSCMGCQLCYNRNQGGARLVHVRERVK